jgi:hypothetical protein
MTGPGVERTPRTAYPMPSVPPTGVSTLMPPHIQGAERRTERRARATRSRWALRALVVGGLAGAAWLLTGAAAQAADRDTEPSGSLLGSVVHGDATAPVTGLLQAAVRPLETTRPAHRHHVVADVLEVPRRVLSRPVRTLDELTHGTTGTTVDAAVGGVDQVLREVAGPLRLTGGPTVTQQLLDPAPKPVATSVAPRPVAKPATPRPGDDRHPHEADAPVHQVPQAAPVARVSSVVRAGSTAIMKARRAPAAVPVRHVQAASTPSAHRHRAATSVARTPATVHLDLPGGDGPAAPLQLHLGDVSGTPTSGSGTPTEGGSAAFLPAAITDSTMACHLLPIASDVEVRRHDAEAPTVSPD